MVAYSFSIQGFQQKNAYIATDNPMVNTLGEFWQMVHEQGSPIVIMLNNWKEGREVRFKTRDISKNATKCMNKYSGIK